MLLTEIMDFRGYGTQLTHTPFLNVSGTYHTNYGNMHLLQQGTSVTGCYEHAGGLLTGGVEGRIMRFAWTEAGSKGGPAVMVFSPDGNNLYGLWWNQGEDQTKSVGGTWNGHKLSTTVGTRIAAEICAGPVSSESTRSISPRIAAKANTPTGRSK